MTKNSNDQYGREESEKRMTAALRGARIAQPKPLKDVPKKRKESQDKSKKKPA